MKRILSIQGGGQRGIIPAIALVTLESQLGKPARKVFDFIGGTSTGAAIAACLVAGVPATSILDMYLKRGREIFSPPGGFMRYSNLITQGRIFDNRKLFGVIQDALASVSNAWMTVNDSPIGVMITAGDQLGHCWYFVKDSPTNAGTTGRALLVDAATASCCATTFHDPWLIKGFGYFADGGCVSLADPIYQTLVEAFINTTEIPNCYGAIDARDAMVVSLGTGWYKPPSIPAPPGNLLASIEWVTSSLVSSSETLAQEAADRHWPRRIKVFNPNLLKGVDEDDVTQNGLLQDVGNLQASSINWVTVLAL